MNPNEFVNICHERLKTSQEGFNYLTKDRHLTVELIKAEKIGFCDFAISKQFCEDGNGRWKAGPSFFSNRIVIPIRDDCGRILAWASRSIIKDQKGWWNYPFRKEFNLYGLDIARNSAFAYNKIYLVEGYMDVLALRVAGLKNVIGLMGTRLTMGHVGLILRYCDRVVFCFDGDPDREVDGTMKDGPGIAALKKVVAEWGSRSHFDEMSTILLPPPNDPAEYIQKNSLNSFLSLEQRIRV